MITETISRTLEPREPASSAAQSDASRTLVQFLERSLAAARENAAGLGEASTPARSRGRRGGRAKIPHLTEKIAEARQMMANQTRPMREICQELGISRATLYRYLKQPAAGED